MNSTTTVSNEERDTVLELLTATTPVAYRQGAVIYSDSSRHRYLHLVVTGRVTVSRNAADHRVVLDVYGPEDFFGEAALLGESILPEQATALEDAQVMRWSRSNLEKLVLQRPQLGFALMQMLARRSMEFGSRLENCLGRKTDGRLLHCLIRLSERSRTPGTGGRVHLSPLSHQLLSEYVGSSRDIVTLSMQKLRQQGILDYSHQEIVLMPRAFEAVGHSTHISCQSADSQKKRFRSRRSAATGGCGNVPQTDVSPQNRYANARFAESPRSLAKI